jgi:hypothetical protein
MLRTAASSLGVWLPSTVWMKRTQRGKERSLVVRIITEQHDIER